MLDQKCPDPSIRMPTLDSSDFTFLSKHRQNSSKLHDWASVTYWDEKTHKVYMKFGLSFLPFSATKIKEDRIFTLLSSVPEGLDPWVPLRPPLKWFFGDWKTGWLIFPGSSLQKIYLIGGGKCCGEYQQQINRQGRCGTFTPHLCAGIKPVVVVVQEPSLLCGIRSWGLDDLGKDAVCVRGAGCGRLGGVEVCRVRPGGQHTWSLLKRSGNTDPQAGRAGIKGVMAVVKEPLFWGSILQAWRGISQWRVLGVGDWVGLRPHSHRTRNATHRAMRNAMQSNGTCYYQWECSHCTHATSKDLHSNLRARGIPHPVWIRPEVICVSSSQKEWEARLWSPCWGMSSRANIGVGEAVQSFQSLCYWRIDMFPVCTWM